MDCHLGQRHQPFIKLPQNQAVYSIQNFKGTKQSREILKTTLVVLPKAVFNFEGRNLPHT